MEKEIHYPISGKSKTELSKTDKLIESISFAGLLFMWLFIFYSYAKLPDTIPSHFDTKGNVNGYASKISIFFLPLVITVIFGVLTYLNQYAPYLRFRKKTTEENNAQQYAATTRTLRIIKLVIVLFMSDIVFSIVKNASSKDASLGIWFLPLFVGAIVFPIIILLIKSNRNMAAKQ